MGYVYCHGEDVSDILSWMDPKWIATHIYISCIELLGLVLFSPLN